MRNPNKNIRTFLPYFVVWLLLMGISNTLLAQKGVELSSDYRSVQNTEIAEQDTSKFDLEKGSWNIGAFPVIFYSDETRLAGGAGARNRFKICSTLTRSQKLENNRTIYICF